MSRLCLWLACRRGLLRSLPAGGPRHVSRARYRHVGRQGGADRRARRASSARPAARSTCRGRIPAGRSRTRRTGCAATEDAIGALRAIASGKSSPRVQRHRPLRPDARRHAARRGRPACCGPCILWNDDAQPRRGRASSTPIRASAQITGNIAMPGFTAPKLVWVRSTSRRSSRKVAKVLLPKDYRAAAADRRARLGNVGFGRHLLARRRAARPGRDELLAATGLDRGADADAGRRHRADRHAARRARRSAGAWPSVSWSPAAPATMRLRPAAWARCGRARAFVSLGTSGVLFVANARYLAQPGTAPCTPSATRCPAPGTRWA